MGQLNLEFGAELNGLSQEGIETIADENAAVEASLEYEEAPRATLQYLTAPEDCDRFVVI